MKVLVTGGIGFIGSHVVNRLFDYCTNCIIVVYDRYDYVSDINNIREDIRKDYRFHFVQGDINNKYLVEQTLIGFEIDTVLHFAAQTHVDNSFENEEEFIVDNIMGTNSLLHVCRKYGKIEKFIHVSTDEVYGEVENDHNGCKEDDVMLPTNPYAATKAGAEHIARAYYKSYKIPIIITRCNNVYGPNQYPEKLIPRFINLMLKNEPVTIHGKGESYRNFIYCDDVSDAFMIILKKGEIGEIYNIGTDQEYNVNEILKMLENRLGKAKVEYVKDRNFNDKRYRLNAEKIAKLGFKAMVNIQEGLDKTIMAYVNK